MLAWNEIPSPAKPSIASASPPNDGTSSGSTTMMGATPMRSVSAAMLRRPCGMAGGNPFAIQPRSTSPRRRTASAVSNA